MNKTFLSIIILIYRSKSKMWEIYTDWSSLWNPWPWWWGYILLDQKNKIKIEQVWWEKDTTNNRMELQAVIQGLKQLLKKHDITISIAEIDQWLWIFWETSWWSEWWVFDGEVVIFTDSTYVKQWITERIETRIRRDWRLSKWGKLVKNSDLWQELHVLVQQFENLERQRVKAHVWNKWNERVDDLARGAAERV